MSNERITAIRERLDATTPEDFKWPAQLQKSYDYVLEMAEINGFSNVTLMGIAAVRCRREDLEYLLAEVKRLRKVLTDARSVIWMAFAYLDDRDQQEKAREIRKLVVQIDAALGRDK